MSKLWALGLIAEVASCTALPLGTMLWRRSKRMSGLVLFCHVKVEEALALSSRDDFLSKAIGSSSKFAHPSSPDAAAKASVLSLSNFSDEKELLLGKSLSKKPFEYAGFAEVSAAEPSDNRSPVLWLCEDRWLRGEDPASLDFPCRAFLRRVRP